MKKQVLDKKVEEFNGSTKEAIEVIINSVAAKGQRKKMLQNAKVQAIIKRYGVEVGA